MRFLGAIRANTRSNEVDIFHDESLRKYNLGDFHILKAKCPVAFLAVKMDVFVIVFAVAFVAVAEFILGLIAREDLVHEMMRSECS